MKTISVMALALFLAGCSFGFAPRLSQEAETQQEIATLPSGPLGPGGPSGPGGPGGPVDPGGPVEPGGGSKGCPGSGGPCSPVDSWPDDNGKPPVVQRLDKWLASRRTTV